MRCNSHTVICILTKHTIQWIFVYSQSCGTNTTISNFRTHPVLKEMSHPLTGTPYSSPPQPFSATNLLLIQWIYLFQTFHINRTLIHPCHNMYINTPFFFNGSIICHCMYIPFIQSSTDGYLGSFLFFSIMNNAPMNICIQFFFPLNMFSILLGVHHYTGNVGSY